MAVLKTITDEKTYRLWKGADWPTYQDFINNNYNVDSKIQAEIKEFIKVLETRYENIATPRTIELSLSNQKRQNQIFFDKHYKLPYGCSVPWKTMGINANGNVYICQSPSWIPKFVGNIFDTDNIYEILNSEISLKIRQEIIANRYYYCNNNICHYFGNINKENYNQTPINDEDLRELEFVDSPNLYLQHIPSELIFDFDYTCNFKCPSCRTEIQNWNNDHIIRPINDRIVEKIKVMVIDKIEDQNITIRWCGGEPFMSDVYINLFDYIISTGKKNIQSVIQTNGSLFEAKEDLMIRFLPYISELYVSFDAGCEETYQKTRLGGNWQRLLDNTTFIINLIKKHNFKTMLKADFVVQKDNYKDIPKFVQLCKELGIKPNKLQKMWNWGTWDIETFHELNVYDFSHPLYEEVKKQFELANLPIAKN